MAEVLGAVAVVLNFIGYKQQDINRYRLISSMALAFVSAHFFLLGAIAAGIGCALASVRNIVAMRYRGKLVLGLFVLANIAFFIYEWFYLQSEWIILLAYSSSMIFTVGSIVLSKAKQIRQWFILAEVLGLAYAIAVGSIFGTIFNLSNLSSILYTLWKDSRHKLNKSEL